MTIVIVLAVLIAALLGIAASGLDSFRVQRVSGIKARPGRSVLFTAMAASAAAHLLILNLEFTYPPLDGAPLPEMQAIDVGSGDDLRVVAIVYVQADVSTRVAATRRVLVPARLSLSMPFAGPVMTELVATRRLTGTLWERLAPRSVGLRLRVSARDPLVARHDHANRMHDRLTAYNDSAALATAAAERAMDWTERSEDGGRWGIAPGAIHFGSRSMRLNYSTLPGQNLPFSLPSPGRREEIGSRLRTFNESRQQFLRAEIAPRHLGRRTSKPLHSSE
ncbi:MAG: hypothetical protein ACREL7_06210 [Longimicrobiales bacterium]